MENTQDRLTRALDEALEMTFPASDPIAVTPMNLAGPDSDYMAPDRRRS